MTIAADGAPRFADLIREGYKSKPPQRWPTFDGMQLDRNMFMTASEAHRCERQIWFDKNITDEVPNKGTGWGYFERGHTMEAWTVDLIRLGLHMFPDVKFMNMGDDQVSYYWGFQSGTPDALVFNEHDDCYVVDFKSIDPRTNKKYLPKPEHVTQVQQNMDLIAHCTNHNVVGAILFYVDASNYEDTIQKFVEPDEKRMEYLHLKSRKIMTATKAEDLQPEGLWTKDGCKYCDFGNKCAEALQQKTETDTLHAQHEKDMQDVFRGN